MRYGKIDHEYGAKLATTPADQDGPVWMVNADGRDLPISGQEADEVAIADTYTMILRPTIDRLAQSTQP